MNLSCILGSTIEKVVSTIEEKWTTASNNQIVTIIIAYIHFFCYIWWFGDKCKFTKFNVEGNYAPLENTTSKF